MKIVCYGASVTAQKKEGGYFFYLNEYFSNKQNIEIERLAFGASHFDYAGFGFSSLLLEQNPDIALIDWLTPSMRRFNLDKIKKLNNELIKANCLPVWVHFPRKDDLMRERPCFHQVKNVADESGCVFYDLCEVLSEADVVNSYLRDIVHTTVEGAKCYSDNLITLLSDLEEGSYFPQVLPLENPISIPKIVDINNFIDQNQSIVLRIKKSAINEKCELLINSKIGPNVCLLNVKIFDEDRHIIRQHEINPADPWCHYTRKMILPTIDLGVLHEGSFISIEYGGSDALESVRLRGEIKETLISKKFIDLFSIACNYELEVI